MAQEDFQQAFWSAKHALSAVTAEAFSRHGIHEGQQFILRCLWTQDGMTPGEVARRLGLATPIVTRAEREAVIAALRAIRENLTTGGRTASDPEAPGR